MRRILKMAQAGTLESSDALVTVAPGETGSGISIEIQSSVLLQYGDVMRTVVEKTLAEQQVTDVFVKIVDRGALDCALKARVLAAIARAGVELKEAF